MKYNYITAVKNDDRLRESFNELTRKTFCFDFVSWYETGHWGEMYLPHVLVDGDKVISNVSVNLMQFDLNGEKKNYIQLGTVMTDPEYRGQGLNRFIMEQILREYEGKVDGIYLFGNDSVLDYYPKFGFRPSKEYEYYLPSDRAENSHPYQIEKVDMSRQKQQEKLYEVIRSYEASPGEANQNDGMYMSENIGLYQFWLDAEYGDSVYYLPEADAYLIARVEEKVLHVYQIFGKKQLQPERLISSFSERIEEMVFGYTPVHKEKFLVREHKEEDCTLFILGEDLTRIEENQMMFPILSHA